MQYLSSAIYQLISIIMSLLISIGVIIPPATDAPIKPQGDANLSFVAIADSQVSNYLVEREEVFISVTDDLKNSENSFDALVFAGDITENGFQSEYDRITTDLDGVDVETYVIVSGNHDIRLREYEQSSTRLLEFMDNLNGNDESKKQNSLYYSMDLNGYRFIVLGSEKTEFEKAYISGEQLGWLDNQLSEATKDGKPAFVICHYPLKNTHGLPGTWGNDVWDSGDVGDSSDDLFEIMNNYDNVFFITGHLHTGFGQYTHEELGNVHSVNLPSVCIENKDGDYNDAGIGYFVEVYDDSVIFRARDYAKGIYLPDYDLEFVY